MLAVLGLYLVFLFLLATWTERRAPKIHPVLYALSLTSLQTSWTYYGNIELAAGSGMAFLSYYLGVVACAACFWLVLRRLVRKKNEFRITNVADFLSARYGKSR
ncbi:MAG: histidine kinase, partial [Bacteroidota bacterium]